jgi:hypothetical protein
LLGFSALALQSHSNRSFQRYHLQSISSCKIWIATGKEYWRGEEEEEALSNLWQ